MLAAKLDVIKLDSTAKGAPFVGLANRWYRLPAADALERVASRNSKVRMRWGKQEPLRELLLLIRKVVRATEVREEGKSFHARQEVWL